MATVPTHSLPEEWAKFEVPEKIKFIFGSKNRTKFLMFADHFEVDNADYDELMAIKPQRRNGEGDELYKSRSSLQKFMGKYKPDFYDYSVYQKQ